jgi:hypothetical protein
MQVDGLAEQVVDPIRHRSCMVRDDGLAGDPETCLAVGHEADVPNLVSVEARQHDLGDSTRDPSRLEFLDAVALDCPLTCRVARMAAAKLL